MWSQKADREPHSPTCALEALSLRKLISRSIGHFRRIPAERQSTKRTHASKWKYLAPREQHFEEMKMGTRSRDTAKLLIVGTVRQISSVVFGLGARPARSLF
jgi:hypothetical protein